LEKKLKSYKTQLTTVHPIIKYTVTKDGNITDPKIVKGVNHEIDSAIVAALITAPPFSPAKYDGVITMINTSRVLILYSKSYTAYRQPFQDSFKFKGAQRIQSGVITGTTSPRSDGSVLIEYRVPSQ
jgi:hypothetical protein